MAVDISTINGGAYFFIKTDGVCIHPGKLPTQLFTIFFFG